MPDVRLFCLIAVLCLVSALLAARMAAPDRAVAGQRGWSDDTPPARMSGGARL